MIMAMMQLLVPELLKSRLQSELYLHFFFPLLMQAAVAPDHHDATSSTSRCSSSSASSFMLLQLLDRTDPIFHPAQINNSSDNKTTSSRNSSLHTSSWSAKNPALSIPWYKTYFATWIIVRVIIHPSIIRDRIMATICPIGSISGCYNRYPSGITTGKFSTGSDETSFPEGCNRWWLKGGKW